MSPHIDISKWITPTGGSPFGSRKSFTLYHNPLIADVDEHLKLLDHFVFLGHLSLQFVNFLLLLLLDNFEVILRFLQFASEVSSNPVLRGLVGLRVNGWFVLCDSRRNFCRVAINGSSGIINITGE